MVFTRKQNEQILARLVFDALREPDDGSSIIMNSLEAHDYGDLGSFMYAQPTDLEQLT